MTKRHKASLMSLCVGVCMAIMSSSAAAAKYDMVTSTKAVVAKETLSNIDLASLAAPDGSSTEMYSPDKMDRIIENSILVQIVKDQDKCQFTTDIEDRARLVKSPVFMYAWGTMLLEGICVRTDRDLAVGYIRKAADEGYAPAMVQLAQFFESGAYVGKNLNLSEIYMHTAAALGSKSARLGWADMLVRGFGSPEMYSEAYAWLYHSQFIDDYSIAKKEFLQDELKKHLPPNVIAVNETFEPDY